MLKLTLKANGRWLVYHDGKCLGTVWKTRQGKNWTTSICRKVRYFCLFKTRREAIEHLIEIN